MQGKEGEQDALFHQVLGQGVVNARDLRLPPFICGKPGVGFRYPDRGYD
jgi:hypothetical protein